MKIDVSSCTSWSRRRANAQQPGGREKIAQRLIAGLPIGRGRGPSGTAEPFAQCKDAKLFRPFGTRPSIAPVPSWAILGRPFGTIGCFSLTCCVAQSSQALSRRSRLPVWPD